MFLLHNVWRSILSLIGQGCHRISEIAARLGKPATALSRPIQRLQEMDLIHREQPFGEAERGGKPTLYKISDPFLRFWFRFVDIDRSRLGAGLVNAVAADMEAKLPHHIGEIWEELARASVTHLNLGGKTWGPASRWWGAGLDPQAARSGPTRLQQRRPEPPGRRGKMGRAARRRAIA